MKPHCLVGKMISSVDPTCSPLCPLYLWCLQLTDENEVKGREIKHFQTLAKKAEEKRDADIAASKKEMGEQLEKRCRGREPGGACSEGHELERCFSCCSLCSLVSSVLKYRLRCTCFFVPA